MSETYVKKYDIGAIRLDTPSTNFIYELPLLSFSDILHTVGLSLVYHSRIIDDPFSIAAGYKLNLQKRLILSGGVPLSYENGDGSLIAINSFDGKFTFEDDSQRIMRYEGGSFVVENPDYSTETFNSSGYITSVKDKYGNTLLTYTYTSNKLISVTYRDSKTIALAYSGDRLSHVRYPSNDSNFSSSFSYSGSTVTVQHYSGVDYHIEASSSGFTAYSTDASAAFSSVYSQKLVCTVSTSSLNITKIIGSKTVDSLTYSFTYLNSDEKLFILDVTDRNGITTRTQYAENKAAYSYEVNNAMFREYQYEGKTEYKYAGTVAIHSNGEIAGYQTYSDGAVMIRTTNGMQTDINTFDSPTPLTAGAVTLSGWLKALGGPTQCKVYPCIGDSAMSEALSVNVEIKNGLWTYFTYTFVFTGEAQTIHALTQYSDAYVLARDFRISSPHEGDTIAEGCTHITSNEDLLISKDSEGNSSITFSLALPFPFYADGVLINEKITAKDLMKYQINQRYGTNKNEVYYNNCRGIKSGVSSFEIGYKPSADGDEVKLSVDSLVVGNRRSARGRSFVTENLFYTLSDGKVYLKCASSADGVFYSQKFYNDKLDVISTIEDKAVTTYVRDYDDTSDSSAFGLITSKTLQNTSQSITIENQIEYDAAKSCILSTTDEFGTKTLYTTDTTWGTVTKTTVNDVTSVTDYFDDDLDTKTKVSFMDDTAEEIEHELSYTDGNLSRINSGSLYYDFSYSGGSLTTVKKMGTDIESHALSDNDKTLTSKYPNSSSPIYTVVRKTDNYGRTSEITGLVTNTYDINPVCSSGVYSTAGIDNGSGKLATSTDKTNNKTTKYGYLNDRVSKIGVFSSGGTKLREESFTYDGIGRLTTDSFLSVSDSTVIQSDISYVKAADSPIADNRTSRYLYKVNNVEKARTNNTYDVFKRLLSKRVDLLSHPFTKTISYDKTRISRVIYDNSIKNIHDVSYTYDALGRIIEEADTEYTRYNNTYVYDSLGRLVRENNKALDKTYVYEYNEIGNITSVKSYDYTTEEIVSGTYSTESYVYNSSVKDRLDSYNGMGISYDANGYPKSFTSNGVPHTLTWTKGKLTKYVRGSRILGIDTYTYTYDAYGRRISKNYTFTEGRTSLAVYVTSSSTVYTYDASGRLIREQYNENYNDSSSNSRDIFYLYDESGIVGAIQTYNSTTETFYFDRNIKGDVIGIYNASGTRVAVYDYNAWGYSDPMMSSTSSFALYNPIRYRGYYFDAESGFYFLNARYYNPEWRRFISPDDTVFLDPETPNGLNLYAYCYNDPINYVDPSGHIPVDTIIDFLSLGYDVYCLTNDEGWRDWENWATLILDGIFFFIPYIPAVSKLAKGAANIDNVMDVANGFVKIDNIQDAIVIGNNMDRVKDVATIQGAVFYSGYEPINMLVNVGRAADVTLEMKFIGRLDNAKWLTDKVLKGYKILDIGKDTRTYFKMFLSAYGMERRLLFYMKNLGKARFLGYLATKLIR